MPDDPKPVAPELVAFLVDGIRGLYVPLPSSAGIMRLIPNTPAALESAQRSLRWSRAAWLN